MIRATRQARLACVRGPRTSGALPLAQPARGFRSTTLPSPSLVVASSGVLGLVIATWAVTNASRLERESQKDRMHGGSMRGRYCLHVLQCAERAAFRNCARGEPRLAQRNLRLILEHLEELKAYAGDDIHRKKGLLKALRESGAFEAFVDERASKGGVAPSDASLVDYWLGSAEAHFRRRSDSFDNRARNFLTYTPSLP